VELSLNPNDRMDSLDFLKICRAELDRLIEQSPPIPSDIIHRFEGKFGSIKDLKRPDVCGALEHTSVFESSEARLRNLAADAALMLRRKRQTLNELVSPQIEQKINEQVQARLQEALEERKKKIEEEIEIKRKEAERTEEEMKKAIDERRKKIQEEIDLEKQKLYQEPVHQSQSKMGGSQFESRLNYRRGSSPVIKAELSRKAIKSEQLSSSVNNSVNSQDSVNRIIVPSENNVSDEKIIIINRE
jgi:hypothetical protein